MKAICGFFIRTFVILVFAGWIVSCSENENSIKEATIRNLVEAKLSPEGTESFFTGYFEVETVNDLENRLTKGGLVSNRADTLTKKEQGYYYSYISSLRYFVERQVYPEYERYVEERDTVIQAEERIATLDPTDPGYQIQLAMSKEYKVKNTVRLVDSVVSEVKGLSVNSGVANATVVLQTKNVTPFGIIWGIKENITKEVSVSFIYKDGAWEFAPFNSDL